MSRSNNQLNLPPLEVEKVGGVGSARDTVPTQLAGRSAELVGSLDLVTVARLAAKRVGYYDKELADVFKLSPSDFSKAFDPDEQTRNRPMKATLPKEYAEAFVRTMAEMLGLRIGGSEAQSKAFKNLVRACADVIEVGQP